MYLDSSRTCLVALICAAALAGCTPAPIASGINDPMEQDNRDRHQFNRALDTAFVSPIAEGYGNIVPVPVQNGLRHFADNIDTPRRVVNNILQLRFAKVVNNTTRFVVNTTLGILGIFDPATALLGIQRDNTDFGETMHVWGVPEGPYTELPFFGPATTRAAGGMIVDLALNPIRWTVSAPENYADKGAALIEAFGARHRHADLIDSILYDSADSYAQARLFYLQNRRFKLGGTRSDTYSDPYAGLENTDGDPDAETTYIDPYSE